MEWEGEGGAVGVGRGLMAARGFAGDRVGGGDTGMESPVQVRPVCI